MLAEYIYAWNLIHFMSGSGKIFRWFLISAGTCSESGVVNQTTMLASDTQAIADHLRSVMMETYKLTQDTIAEKVCGYQGYALLCHE